MSELLSGHELDKAIAVALGIVVEAMQFGSRGIGYTLTDPTHKYDFLLSGGNDWTEENAWFQLVSISERLDYTEAICAERGWSLQLHTTRSPLTGVNRIAQIWGEHGYTECSDTDGSPIATKAARALLAALNDEWETSE